MSNRLFAAVGAALMLVVGGSAATAQPARPAPPPIEAYGQLPGLDQVSISPDGTRLAFIGQVGDKRRLGVQTLAGQALGAVDLGDVKIRAISWLDNNHIVIVRSTTTTRLSAYGDITEAYNGQIYNVETRQFANVLSSVRGVGSSRTGDEMVLNVFAAYGIRVIDGKRTMLVTVAQTGDRHLFKIDPDTGVATPYIRDFTRFEMAETEPVFESSGLVDAEGKPYVRVETRFNTGHWRVLAVNGVDQREVYKWEGGNAVVSWPSLLGEGRRAGTVIISVPGAVNENATLYEIDLATGEKKKLSFEGGHEWSPSYDPITGHLIGFSALVGNDFERIYFDERAGRAWATLKASFPNGFLNIEDRNDDFTKYVVRVDSDTEAGAYMFVDLKAGKAIRIGSAYPGVPSAAVNERRYITYKAADGMDIPAYLTLPRGRDPRGLPLIVLPHGGPASRDFPGFDWWSQAIASRGYAVLQPQFRGSRGFGEAHMAAGYGQWGRTMQTDLSDGVRYLAAQGIVDPKKVCITGWSYGGYATAAGVTLDPGVYRCAAAGAGVYDLRQMIWWANGESTANDTPTGRYWKQNMGASRIGDTGLDAVSPARFVERINVPFLLMHGEDDTIVPMKQTDLMAAAMRRAGKPVSVVVLPNEDHWLSTGATRTRMLQETIKFLEQHNPPY